MSWFGSKACKKKYLKSFSWLKHIKNKSYPFWRLDTYFSGLKNINLQIVNDGGWHFSNIKTPKEIEFKLRSYLHHREFDENPLSVDQIDEIIKNKQAIYDLKVDKTVNKIGNGNILKKFELNKLPALGFVEIFIGASNSSSIIVKEGVCDAPAKTQN